jgi:hypothetical protein
MLCTQVESIGISDCDETRCDLTPRIERAVQLILSAPLPIAASGGHWRAE